MFFINLKMEILKFSILCILYIIRHLLIPPKCTVSLIYIHLVHGSYIFQCLCTIIRENNYASSSKNQLLL